MKKLFCILALLLIFALASCAQVGNSDTSGDPATDATTGSTADTSTDTTEGTYGPIDVFYTIRVYNEKYDPVEGIVFRVFRTGRDGTEYDDGTRRTDADGYVKIFGGPAKFRFEVVLETIPSGYGINRETAILSYPNDTATTLYLVPLNSESGK